MHLYTADCFLYVFGRPGLGAASSIYATISSMAQTRSVRPAAIAGVVRNVLWMRVQLENVPSRLRRGLSDLLALFGGQFFRPRLATTFPGACGHYAVRHLLVKNALVSSCTSALSGTSSSGTHTSAECCSSGAMQCRAPTSSSYARAT